jgi:hypothetical protein
VNTIVTVRYVSGRGEKFEIDLWGGAGAKDRLQAFLKTPNVVVQTDTELIIIPGSAIECISITLPEAGESQLHLGAIRSAKRLD